jgi:adenylate kinase family enzyme
MLSMVITPERIYIIGTSGSGKTTLAKQLADILGHPHIDLDPVRYPQGRGRLSHEESIAAAKEIADQQSWIAEGIYLYWVEPLLDRANHIVWVDTPRNKAVFRIMRRYLVNKLKGTEEHGFKETIKFAWGSRGQHDNRRTELVEEDGMISPFIIEKTLEPYKDKLFRIRNKHDLRRYIEQF